jgi:hypothetical protein
MSKAERQQGIVVVMMEQSKPAQGWGFVALERRRSAISRPGAVRATHVELRPKLDSDNQVIRAILYLHFGQILESRDY